MASPGQEWRWREREGSGPAQSNSPQIQLCGLHLEGRRHQGALKYPLVWTDAGQMSAACTSSRRRRQNRCTACCARLHHDGGCLSQSVANPFKLVTIFLHKSSDVEPESSYVSRGVVYKLCEYGGAGYPNGVHDAQSFRALNSRFKLKNGVFCDK
jgi:hypothetical protein